MSPTPGPWIACDSATVSVDDLIEVVPTHVKRRFVREDGCRVTQFICDCNTLLPEHAANARLIAAAPDLLEAAESALRVLSEYGNGTAELSATRQLRAAIAKARSVT